MKKIKQKYLGSTIRDHHGNWLDVVPGNEEKLERFPHLFVEEKRKPTEKKPKLVKDAEDSKGSSKRNSGNSNRANNSDKS